MPVFLDTTLWAQAVSKDPRPLPAQEKNKTKQDLALRGRKTVTEVSSEHQDLEDKLHSNSEAK